jgi:ATP-dependent Clp protease ATP-binding subunit ClpA
LFERFSREARTVVVSAHEAARSADDPAIGAIHLLIGLAGPDRSTSDLLAEYHLDREAVVRWATEHRRGGLDASALSALGIDLEAIRTTAESTFGRGALDDDPPSPCRWPLRRTGRARFGHLPFTDGAKKSLELSLRETIRLGGSSIDAEAVLLGLLRADDREVRLVLAEFGVDVRALRRAAEGRLRRAA